MQKKHSGRTKKLIKAIEDIIRYANHCKHRDGFRIWVNKEGMHYHCELCGKTIVKQIDVEDL